MTQALSNVRILDLSMIVAGPYGTMMLADLGAEVIKIENPNTGEAGRGLPPHYFEGESAYFISLNRNKKSVTLDLKSETGLNIFYDLVKTADVVVNNFRPGVLKRLKIDYATLDKINPRIICCSITGYGETGPTSDRPAFDLIVQARGGIMSFTGETNRKPVKMGAPMADLSGGVFASNGILAALYHREITGRGQNIDISMLDCQISLMTYRAQYYLVAGEIAKPNGCGHTAVHPLRDFRTRTFDIVLDCNTQKIFDDMAQKIGDPRLIDNPKFNSRNNRYTHREDLYTILEEIFTTRTGEEWLELLEEIIPIGPVNTVDRALADPQILSRNMVVEIPYGNQRLKIVGNPIKMSANDEVFTGPPRLGQDTDSVLTSILGYSQEKIDELRMQKVV
jgi:CoA:oxalate CoA-transferase